MFRYPKSGNVLAGTVVDKGQFEKDHCLYFMLYILQFAR